MQELDEKTIAYDRLLHLIQSSPTINTDDVLFGCEKMIKRLKVQELIDSGVHKYAVTVLKNGGGYQTHVKDENGKRKIIYGRTEDGFYNSLYEYYFGDKARIRMCDLFEEWLEERVKTNLSPRTIKRYRDAYEKYLEGTVLDTTPISKITPEMVTDFFNSLIGEQGLTDKQYGNIIVIPNKLFSYAAFKGITPQNPMANAMINRRALRHTRAAKTSDRIYYEGERAKFMVALNCLMEKEPDRSDYYAILLLWILGLRIGELVALKWTDIDYDAKEIHIQRMESRNEDNKPVIVEHCKGNSPTADRVLSISDYELDLFEHIRKLNKRCDYVSDFIFVGYNYKTCQKERRTIKNIDSSIRRICRKAEIPEKSAHDIRRSVASTLFANGESLESIRKLLGHSDLKTTSDYIVDTNGIEDRNERIHSILSNNLPMLDTTGSYKSPSSVQNEKQGTGVELPEGSKIVAFRAKSTDVRQNVRQKSCND